MEKISRVWSHIQNRLFPFLQEYLDPMTETEKRAVAVLEVISIETFIPPRWWTLGRPPKDRCALAKAFVLKMLYNCPATSDWIDMLKASPNLRRICGWEEPSQIPSESTFSRSFAEFARTGLPQKAHEALIKNLAGDRLVGHISRDATDIPVREKAAPKPPKPQASKAPKKRGRPKKGEVRPPKEPTRIQKQLGWSLPEMMADLPTLCDWGVKEKGGSTYFWKGFKLHLDWADGEVPISCILTSASVHDSQAAIPLATMTASRVTSLYDLMDSAYHCQEIHDYSVSLGHVPLIDPNSRSGRAMKLDPAQRRRFDERSTAERGNSLLKEGYGARHILVRGYLKVSTHLMFCVLALAAERLLNLVT